LLDETAKIRAADWSVAPTPEDLQDRRVEITGPFDRKMVINALDFGANCFMADFEDSNFLHGSTISPDRRISKTQYAEESISPAQRADSTSSQRRLPRCLISRAAGV
jgi:malate synthase